MRKLTDRQQQIFEFIRHHIDESGCPPTRAEIAQAMNFKSINAAEDHLRALARKGVIVLRQGVSRGIFLPDTGMPIVNKVTAGQPLLSESHIEEFLKIKRDFFPEGADFFVRIKDMSMKNAGILDGDLLAVRKTSEIADGQIVVARLNEEVTVKRYYKKDNKIRLVSEHPDVAPVEMDEKHGASTIEGLAVGVIRHGIGAIQ